MHLQTLLHSRLELTVITSNDFFVSVNQTFLRNATVLNGYCETFVTIFKKNSIKKLRFDEMDHSMTRDNVLQLTASTASIRGVDLHFDRALLPPLEDKLPPSIDMFIEGINILDTRSLQLFVSS